MHYTIDDLLKSKKWDSKYKFTVVEKPLPNLIGAFITKDWHVNVEVDLQLDSNICKIIKDYNKKVRGFLSIGKPFFEEKRNNLDDLVYFVVDHEIGHWEECPFDIEYEKGIRDGVLKGLVKGGLTQSAALNYEPRMSNLFMDIVNNVLNANQGYDPEKYRYGMSLFYLKEGMIAGNFGKEFAVFVDTQLRMCMPDAEANGIVKYFSNYSEIKHLTKKAIKILNSTMNLLNYVDTDFMSRIYKSSSKIQRNLSDKKKWPIKAEKLAELFASFMKDLPLTSPLFSFSSGYASDINDNDKVPAIPEKPTSNIPENAKKPDKNKKGFPTPFLDDLLPEEKVFMPPPPGKLPGKIVYVPGNKVPAKPKNFEDRLSQLDRLYNNRAEEINGINYGGNEEEDHEYVLKHMKKRMIKEPSKVLPSKIDFRKTEPKFKRGLFGTKFDFDFFTKEVPLTRSGRQRLAEKGLRGYAFIVDSSGSMQWNPDSGTGNYDLCLRSVYSIFDYLERTEKAEISKFAAINFSNTTNATPWHSYEELDELKKVLFHHQNGGTTLDPKYLTMLNNDADFKYLAIMVTDGVIDNYQQVIPKVHDIVNLGHEFVLFQLQGVSKFSEELSNSGIDVRYLSNPEDIIGMSLRRVKNG